MLDMKKSILIVIWVALLTSCGMMYESTSNLNLNQTQVVLSSDNFHVVKQVSGGASGTYIFGFGGFGKKSVMNTSISKMTEAAKLTGPQAIIDVSTKTHVRTVLGVWSQISAVSTGTVIEFTRSHSDHYRPASEDNETPVVELGKKRLNSAAIETESTVQSNDYDVRQEEKKEGNGIRKYINGLKKK